MATNTLSKVRTNTLSKIRLLKNTILTLEKIDEKFKNTISNKIRSIEENLKLPTWNNMVTARTYLRQLGWSLTELSMKDNYIDYRYILKDILETFEEETKDTSKKKSKTQTILRENERTTKKYYAIKSLNEKGMIGLGNIIAEDKEDAIKNFKKEFPKSSIESITELCVFKTEVEYE